jgi:hypothetical protein
MALSDGWMDVGWPWAVKNPEFDTNRQNWQS